MCAGLCPPPPTARSIAPIAAPPTLGVRRTDLPGDCGGARCAAGTERPGSPRPPPAPPKIKTQSAWLSQRLRREGGGQFAFYLWPRRALGGLAAPCHRPGILANCPGLGLGGVAGGGGPGKAAHGGRVGGTLPPRPTPSLIFFFAGRECCDDTASTPRRRLPSPLPGPHRPSPLAVSTGQQSNRAGAGEADGAGRGAPPLFACGRPGGTGAARAGAARAALLSPRQPAHLTQAAMHWREKKGCPIHFSHRRHPSLLTQPRTRRPRSPTPSAWTTWN